MKEFFKKLWRLLKNDNKSKLDAFGVCIGKHDLILNTSKSGRGHWTCSKCKYADYSPTILKGYDSSPFDNDYDRPAIGMDFGD